MSRIGNKNQFDERNKNRSDKTKELIRKAIENLKRRGHPLEVEDLSDETKRIDINGQGVSVSALYSKKLTHIQEILMENGVGKYGSLLVNTPADQLDVHDLIKMQQEHKKLKKENQKLKEDNKDLKKNNKESQETIKKLNGKLIEIELKYKLHADLTPINNPRKK